MIIYPALKSMFDYNNKENECLEKNDEYFHSIKEFEYSLQNYGDLHK